MATEVSCPAPRYQTPPLDERSIYLRRLVVRALEGGGRGHIGSSLSLIEIMRVLYDDILRYHASDPAWALRDRCILSKGHGCLAQYVLLADKGFFPLDLLDGFCSYHSILGGHPEAAKVPGVEASTGALGHGLSIGMGRALGLRMKGQQARVFVITGDGEINEGSVWEAALSCSKHRLSNLVVMIDYNKVQSAGATAEILDLEPLAPKWRSFGFATIEVDGHDVGALRQILRRVPLENQRPTAVICHTIKGKGIAFAENDAAWHHKSSLKADVIADLYSALEGR
jgi:transketolase